MPSKYDPEYYQKNRDKLKAKQLRYYYKKRQQMIDAGILIPRPPRISVPVESIADDSAPGTPEHINQFNKRMPKVGDTITLHFD